MVKLRYLTKQDIDTVLAWQVGSDEDALYQWAGSGYDFPLTAEQLDKRLDIDQVNTLGSMTYIYAIIDKSSAVMVGTVELSITDQVKGYGSIGKLLIGSAKERGKGYGRMAVKGVVEEAFEHLGLDNLFLKVFDHNHRAIKCYENVGFNKVRFERNVYKAMHGQWHRYYMALSRDEWPRNKE